MSPRKRLGQIPSRSPGRRSGSVASGWRQTDSLEHHPGARKTAARRTTTRSRAGGATTRYRRGDNPATQATRKGETERGGTQRRGAPRAGGKRAGGAARAGGRRRAKRTQRGNGGGPIEAKRRLATGAKQASSGRRRPESSEGQRRRARGEGGSAAKAGTPLGATARRPKGRGNGGGSEMEAGLDGSVGGWAIGDLVVGGGVG